jgi:hypothetical protein
MTTNTRASNRATTQAQGTGRGGQSDMGSMAMGASVLAGTLVGVLGLYTLFAGIAAVARRNFYTVAGNYPYHLSNNGWAWLFIIGGGLLLLTSLGLFSPAATWARPVAIVLCAASLVASFFFLPFFPLWAIVMSALALFSIWAITKEGSDERMAREQREMQQMGMQHGTSQYANQQLGQPQTGLGTQQNAGAYGTGQQQAGTGSYVPASSYGAKQGQQSGQKWPENEAQSASRMGEQVQSGARSGQQQSGSRNMSSDQSNKSRQTGS